MRALDTPRGTGVRHVDGTPSQTGAVLLRIATSRILVDDADTLFDPFGTDPLCARLKDALGDHDVTVVFAVETSKHIRIPEHCGTRIVFPTGERTVDLMDGIPAGLLSQCGPDDIMTAGRAVLLREGNALWIQCAMAKI